MRGSWLNRGPGVSPGGGRPSDGEAVAMLVVAVAIVLARQSGLWPDAPQGIVGVIVQSAVVLLPIVPRGLRSAFARLRRLRACAISKGRSVAGLTANVRESTADGAGGGSSEVVVSGPVVASEPGEDVGVDDVTAGDLADLGGDDRNPIVLGMLVDPTMWPSWPPTPDNDHSSAPDHGDGVASPRADNDDEAKPTAV